MGLFLGVPVARAIHTTCHRKQWRARGAGSGRSWYTLTRSRAEVRLARGRPITCGCPGGDMLMERNPLSLAVDNASSTLCLLRRSQSVAGHSIARRPDPRDKQAGDAWEEIVPSPHPPPLPRPWLVPGAVLLVSAPEGSPPDCLSWIALRVNGHEA